MTIELKGKSVSKIHNAIVVKPAGTPRASVVWLHGLGADGHDFEPIVPHLGVSDQQIQFVFPHADVQPVTINGGMAMRAWYDIIRADLDREIDLAGVAKSVDRIQQLLIALRAEFGAQHPIIIAGFSQGGVIALQTLLAAKVRCQGVLALSTYLADPDSLKQQLSALADINQTPIMMMHGTNDNIVPMQLGREAADLLTEAGFSVQWQTYPMQHEVCAEQIATIGEWLRLVLR